MLRSCTPPPPTATTSVSGATIARDCETMANNERAARGVPLLASNSKLESAAAKQSAYQASINKMTHTGSGGSTAGTRITAAGYVWGTWAENVAAGQADCTNVMSAWMNSAGHRANILNPSMKHIGVAVAKSSTGTPFWTMDLAG